MRGRAVPRSLSPSPSLYDLSPPILLFPMSSEPNEAGVDRRTIMKAVAATSIGTLVASETAGAAPVAPALATGS